MHKLLTGMFGCSHDHLTFPRTYKGGGQAQGTYVFCLDCGKELAYDWARMKVILKQNQAFEAAGESVPVKVNAA